MNDSIREMQCSHCSHWAVCSLKDRFMAAQRAVNAVHVQLGDNTIEGLHYFDWIKPVGLECVHFLRETETVRGWHTDTIVNGAYNGANRTVEST